MDKKYEPLRLKNQLCFPLYLCAKEVQRRYAPLLDGLNVTYTQYVVMMYPHGVQECSVNLIQLGEEHPSGLEPLMLLVWRLALEN